MNFNPLPRQQVHRSILLSNFTQSVRLKDSTENKLTFFLRLKFCVFSSIPREKYPLIHNISSPAFQTGILVITLFAPGVSWHGNGDDVIRRGDFFLLAIKSHLEKWSCPKYAILKYMLDQAALRANYITF